MSRDHTPGVDEPIAIVGMACRFPGGIDSPDRLWDVVRHGADAVGGFPEDRGWNLDALTGGDGSTTGTTYSTGGGFLYDAAEFDAAFFNISPREARITDPQHRIMLELAWESFERGRIDPTSLRDSRTGVFLGEIWDEYGDRFLGDLLHTDGGFGEHEGHVSVGNSRGVLSGRISYLLGLTGPAVTLDTSCSSSLVALHLAVQSLRLGECDLALAGGVTVMAAPAFIVDFSRQRAFSRDGRSKAFDADADGMGVGEGAGLLVLERVSDAVRLGHPIVAVVRGSAVNQDGTSDGQTAPSQAAQERLIVDALASARLTTRDIDVVEAHGTGTVLGDYVEASALLATYGQDREPGRPLWIGSFKSNVGHSQAAAGAGGLIKMVMAMRHGLMPKTLHVNEPTPKVDWGAGDVEILREERPWQPRGTVRRCAVSSFGISGTNAHVIVEEYPAPTDRPAPATGTGQTALPVVLSARAPESLRAAAARLVDWVADRPTLDVADVSSSLIHTRALHEHRAVAVVSGRDQLVGALNAVSQGDYDPAVATGRARNRKMLFTFPGQGAQWLAMAKELLTSSPVFAARLRDCDDALRPHVDWPLVATVAGGAANLERVEVVQPCLFAMMIALDATWRSYGVRPDGVVGHSQGEIAALCAAGAVSLDEAARVVALRSQALAEIAGTGAMASIHAPLERVRELIAGGGVDVAAVNSASSVVVAGETATVAELLDICAARDIDAHRLPVSYASHSPHIDALEATLRPVLAATAVSAATVPFYSSVTGSLLDPASLDGDYWYQNLRRPVDFRSAVAAALADGFDAVVEVSPHPVLVPAIEQIAEGLDVVSTGTLRRNDGGQSRFLQSAAALHAAGVPVDWQQSFGDTTPATVDLPTYPFFRKRYWVDPPRQRQALRANTVGHPILRDVTPVAHGDLTVYAGTLSDRTQPWIVDHKVRDEAYFPATAFLDIAMSVCARERLCAVEELTIVAPLVVPPGDSVQIQATVHRPPNGKPELTVHSRRRDDEPWTLHATGFFATAVTPAPAAAPAHWPPPGAIRIDTDAMYDELASRGYGYGPAFRGLQRAWVSAGTAYVEVTLPTEVDDRRSGYAIHPAVLDAGLQICATAALVPVQQHITLPFSWQDVTLPATSPDQLRLTITATGEREVSVLIADGDGAPVATIGSLMLREAEAPAAAEPLPDMEIGWDKPRHGDRHDPWPEPDAAELVTCVLDDPGEASSPASARGLTVEALTATQEFLRGDSASRLCVVTYGGVDTGRGDLVAPAPAAVWGLIRSIQREEPGRIMLVDIERGRPVVDQLRVALRTGAPEVAVRQGNAYVSRRRPPPASRIDLTGLAHWQLVPSADGVIDGITAESRPAPAAPGADDVVLSVRASGIAFRDVMIAHNIYPEPAPLGLEVAGVVKTVGAAVDGLAVGDRVFGYCYGTFADSVVVDHRHVVRMPDDWSFAEAAAVPTAYLTAYHALLELAELTADDTILIHSAASGTGMAAARLAQHIGAEVFVTASPAKHQVLRDMGIPDDHIASSRNADFATRFREVRDGRGFDVAIDAFSGALVDATLAAMAPGATFIEIGLRDVRNAAEVAAEYDGLRYHAVNMTKFDPPYYRRAFSEIVGLIEAGCWQKPEVRCWDVRQFRQALRFMSAGHQVGKHVVTIPAPRPDLADGTVVISGGTGMAGAHTARHLIRSWGCRSVALISRSGGDRAATDSLRDELRGYGAEVQVHLCDVADRDALRRTLDGIAAAKPIVGVVHSAGALDDTLATGMTAANIDTVFAPKALGAWNFHELTADMDLSLFVLYSSVAGSLGSPGQANYAAANAYLDGLAAMRRASGRPATSIAWGLWDQPSALTGAALGASAEPLRRLGILRFDVDSALAAFDRALDAPTPVVLCARFEAPRQAPAPRPVRPEQPPAVGAGLTAVLDTVKQEVATTLGLDSPDDVDPDTAFRMMGFDSLTAVELRNRLNAKAGLRLPTTIVFDCHTPQRLAESIARSGQ